MTPAALWHGFVSRPCQFMIQGTLAAMCAAFGSTMAAAAFLSNAGSSALPVYYILFAALSIPVSILFSGVIDRWPRRTLMAALFLTYMVGAIAASALSNGAAVGSYVLYVFVSVCELMIYSVYYIMFADYFTVIEGKRYGGPMTIALGGGAVIGALIIPVVTRAVGADGAFLALLPLVGVTLVHLIWLTRREQPLDEPESGAEEGILESLKSLPLLSRRHPIVLLMAAAVFANIVGQCVMEFEAFSIYAATFPDETELAAFLGKMTAVVDVVGIAIVFITTPLIPRLGVVKMNMVPPLINFVSFLAISLSSGLASGILAHINYYPLEHSLNVPVFALIYNALPHRFVGRVRVINDGVIYPLALAASGGALLLLESRLGLGWIAVLGAVVALGYAVAQWSTGRHYARGLLAMLRGGSVELDQVSEGFKVPEEYVQDIREMLKSDDPDTVILGIELAERCNVPFPVARLERILPLVPRRTAHSALHSLGREDPVLAERQMAELVRSDDPRIRALAIDAGASGSRGLEAAELTRLLDDPSALVRAAAAAALLAYAEEDGDRARAILAGLTDSEAALSALRVLEHFDCSALADVVAGLGRNPVARVRVEALRLATAGGRSGDRALADWARQASADPESPVRAAGIALLARTADTEDDVVEAALAAMTDPQSDVRRAAALVLGQIGGPALPRLAEFLKSGNLQVAFEAMDGIGLAGPRAADAILFAHLTESVFPGVERNLKVARALPLDRPGWQPLKVAIDNSNALAVQTVLHALSVLGYKRALGVVRTAMRANDARTRANAVETLSSLAHRRYLLPLLPLLEAEGGGSDAEAPPPPARPFDPDKARAVLAETLLVSDHFIRAASLIAWNTEFGALPAPQSSDPSPLVESIRAALGQGRHDEDLPMNRLVFLKSVPLFSGMSLDHIMAVDAAMTREAYLPGEKIITEGDVGDKLFIVFRGEVAIRKGQPQGGDRELARLAEGKVFGEMALFDDERRSASVVAVTDADLLALDREKFQSLAYQRPEIPMQLCRVLAERLRAAIA